VIGCSSFLCRFVGIDKMTPEQEQVIEEQQALLEESANMYTGEMEPETKTVEPPKTPEYIEVANGVPAGPGGPVMGAPVSRSAWSTGLFSCLGSQDEFCSSDLEVCKFCFTFCSLSKLSFLLLLSLITSSHILRSFLEDWCVLSTTTSAN
jgi:hypothetical protein